MKKQVFIVLSWLATPLPLIITAFALSFLPEIVPLHWGIDGTVDRWGSPAEFFVTAGIITFANVLCALCTTFTEQLWSMGLVNGVKSPASARKVLLGVIVFCDVLFLVLLAIMGNGAV